MTKKYSDLIEKNILIAKWLGWQLNTSESCPSFEYIKNEHFDGGVEFLNFHSDSNLQWLCLEMIKKDLEETYYGDNNYNLIDTLHTLQVQTQNSYCIDEINNICDFRIQTKNDIFVVVINYIKYKTDNYSN